MDEQTFLFDLIRIKFGFMACFHYLFVPLTLGLVISTACMETAFVWTRDGAWRLAAQFLVSPVCPRWLVGIVTGYSAARPAAERLGKLFRFRQARARQVLPIEAALGPVMLAAVATLALLGERLYPATRMLLMWGLALIMLCQSATILTVNAWMQHPVIAGERRGSHPRTDLAAACSSTHGAVENRTRLQCRARVWQHLHLCHCRRIPVSPQPPARRRVSLRLAVPLGALATALAVGDRPFQCRSVARFQPMKFAAIEGLWKHEAGPAGLIVFARPQSQSQATSARSRSPM